MTEVQLARADAANDPGCAGECAPRPYEACPEPAMRQIETLTSRELDVLNLVCDGASNSDICRRLGVGMPTVKFHVARIFGKLGVQRRTQAVAMAVHLRIVRPAWLDAARPRAG